jgi:hypothetical protein
MMQYSIEQSEGYLVLPGQRFKVVMPINGLNMGDMVKALTPSRTHKFNVENREGTRTTVKLGENVLRILTERKEIDDMIRILNKKIEDCKDRLGFMETCKKDSIDEIEYKRWRMLTEINKETSTEEKLEVINEIIAESGREQLGY